MIERDINYEMPELGTNVDPNTAVNQAQLKELAGLVPLEFGTDIFDLFGSNKTQGPQDIVFPDPAPIENTFNNQIYTNQITNFNETIVELSGGGGDAWNTTAKTTTYTAVDNDEVLCDTATTSAFTVTLPASPTGGERVRIIDSRSNFATANLTVGRNGETIRGAASDLVISTNNENYEFVYNGTDSDWEYLVYKKPLLTIRYASISVFSPTVTVSTGDGKAYFHIPADLNGLNLTEVHAKVVTAGVTGTTDIQINNVTQVADMLSTKITIDSAETGSDTAATPAVIDTANDDVSTNDFLRIDIDAVSTTEPIGLVITLGFS